MTLSTLCSTQFLCKPAGKYLNPKVICHFSQKNGTVRHCLREGSGLPKAYSDDNEVKVRIFFYWYQAYSPLDGLLSAQELVEEGRDTGSSEPHSFSLPCPGTVGRGNKPVITGAEEVCPGRSRGFPPRGDVAVGAGGPRQGACHWSSVCGNWSGKASRCGGQVRWAEACRCQHWS